MRRIVLLILGVCLNVMVGVAVMAADGAAPAARPVAKPAAAKTNKAPPAAAAKPLPVPAAKPAEPVAPVAAPTVAADGFAQGLARALALEEDADFSAAMQLCSELEVKYADHADVNQVKEMLQRLKEEKREALQLPFAMEKLGSDNEQEVEAAQTQLTDAGDVGAIFLRKAVRKGTGKGAIEAIKLLEEAADSRALTAYADRLKTEARGPLTAELVRTFENKIQLGEQQERDLLSEPFGQLYDVVQADSSSAKRDPAGLLLKVLTEWFDGQGKPLDAFLKRPGAFDVLKEYVKRADQSPDRDIAAWASFGLGAVGLENTLGLVAWWKLDDKEGTTAKDSSVSGFHGTLVGGPVWCDGISGGGLQFNGTGARVVNRPDAFPTVTNTFTMSLWACPSAARLAVPESNSDASGTHDQRYAIFPSFGDQYGQQHAGAGVSIGTNGISVCEHAGSYLPALLVYPAAVTNWTHVAVVYENRQPKLYVDGVLAKAGLVSTKTVHPSPGLSDKDGGYGCYAGVLDDVRIYNRVLSPKEIATLARGAKAPAPKPSAPAATP